MKLFTEYQIPSDLLSFDGLDPATGTEIVEAGAAESLEAVRSHVKAMHDMIQQAKDEEIEQTRKEATWASPFYDQPQQQQQPQQQAAQGLQPGARDYTQVPVEIDSM